MSRRRKRNQQNRAVQVMTSQPSVQLLELNEKSNPAYAGAIAYSNAPEARQMPRNYASFSKNGYKAVDVIFKCINYIITNGAPIRPVLYTNDGMKDKIEKHPLLDKLKRPNPEQWGVAYRKAVLGYFLLDGNSFQYAIRNKNAPPDELWTLQPNKVEPVTKKPRGIIGYNYTEWPDEMNPILPENIGFLKTWNPDSETFGTSPLEPGAIKADMQTDALKWNLSLMQNKGKMEGAWSTDAILSPNDRSKLEDRLSNKFAGYRNAGRMPVLDGGLKWNQMSVPPSQMDWLDALKYNAGSLANLYNIPPQLIGDTSSTTYDNMQEAKAASYTEGIFPVLDELYDLWNMWLVPMFKDLCDAHGNPTAYLYYDKESVEVVQAVIQQQKDAKAKRAFQAWALGATSSCTLNEAREMQGLPPDPQGDVYRFGQVIVKKGELDTYAEQSLQKPAAPPMPIPEPDLNQPAPDGSGQPPPTQGQENTPPAPKKPPAASGDDTEPPTTGKKPGKKSRDDGVEYAESDTDPKKWTDPTVDERLADYADRQVTHLRWICDGNPCDLCSQNCNEVVETGSEFPSGDLLPQLHPRCKCDVQEIQAPQFGMMRKPSHTHKGASHESIDITYENALALVDLDTKDAEDATATKGLSREEYRRFMSSTLR